MWFNNRQRRNMWTINTGARALFCFYILCSSIFSSSSVYLPRCTRGRNPSRPSGSKIQKRMRRQRSGGIARENEDAPRLGRPMYVCLRSRVFKLKPSEETIVCLKQKTHHVSNFRQSCLAFVAAFATENPATRRDVTNQHLQQFNSLGAVCTLVLCKHWVPDSLVYQRRTAPKPASYHDT